MKLTFDADRLMYPMRMSAAADDAQRVRIYAVSDHRLRRTDPDAPGQYTDYPFAGWVTTADPDLAEMIGALLWLRRRRVA